MTSLIALGHPARGKGKVGRRGGRMERWRGREAIEKSLRRGPWQYMCRGREAREERLREAWQEECSDCKWWGGEIRECFVGPACEALVAVLSWVLHVWHHQCNRTDPGALLPWVMELLLPEHPCLPPAWECSGTLRTLPRHPGWGSSRPSLFQICL